MGPSSKDFLAKMEPMSKDFWQKLTHLCDKPLYALTCDFFVSTPRGGGTSQ